MKIEHASVYVKDLEGAKEFFAKYFGAIPDGGYYNHNTHFRSYFLTFAGGARLEIMTRPEIREADRYPYALGYAHLAFSAGSKEAVDSLTQTLRADGYSIVSGPRITGDGYYESCILDGEGNQIEITV